MRINYQIMNETNKTKVNYTGGYEAIEYLPNYDELIKKATCKEEAEKWERCKKRKSTFVYNMVFATKQKCGHYEIFQIPHNEHHTLEKNLKGAKEHSARDCTACHCNFK